MIRAVLVDDEPLAISSLKKALGPIGGLQIVGEFQNGSEAAKNIPLLKPDIVFLDIEMPGLNGLQVAEALLDLENTHVVFVTAFSEHAVRAFQVQAVNYILKPYEDSQVAEAVARIKKSKQNRPLTADLLATLIADAKREDGFLTRIMVKDGRRAFIVQVAEIQWIRGAGNYLELHTAQKTYLYRHAFEALEAKLNPRDFVRIHRSKIINVHELALLDKPAKNQLDAITKDGTRHPVSAGYRARLEQLLAG